MVDTFGFRMLAEGLQELGDLRAQPLVLGDQFLDNGRIHTSLGVTRQLHAIVRISRPQDKGTLNKHVFLEWSLTFSIFARQCDSEPTKRRQNTIASHLNASQPIAHG